MSYKECKIDIAVCLDKGFVMPTGVMMYSVCVNNQDVDIDFHVLIDESVTDEDRQDLKDIANKFSGKRVYYYTIKRQSAISFPLNFKYITQSVPFPIKRGSLQNDLRRTCLDKFRSYGDVCRWLLRYWQLASGNFTPYNIFKDGKHYAIKDETIGEISKCIIQQEKNIVCFNDIPVDMHFENNKVKICRAFEQLFPNKSDFEL